MIEIEPRRAEALRIGYEATDWAEWPSYEAYLDAMSDWKVSLISKEGEGIGAVYTRGPEFHISILPEWRGKWMTRRILKQIIPDPVAVTQVRAGHEHVADMLKRLGFEKRSEVYVRQSHGS
jgi:GNAT superfamily N-acetyltransferase